MEAPSASYPPACVLTSRYQLAPGSFMVEASDPHKTFGSWQEQDDISVFQEHRKIANMWQTRAGSNRTDQYMIYGTQSLLENYGFRWEIVPYQRIHPGENAQQKTVAACQRFWQQFQVLLRLTFGRLDCGEEAHLQSRELASAPIPLSPLPEAPSHSNDPFCREGTFQRQGVFKGNKINVLYDFAPLATGPEKLHFLFVTQAHRRDFLEMTQEEYTEAMYLMREVTKKLIETRPHLYHAHMYIKSGVDTGQTIPHTLFHLVITESKPQDDIWGKLSVLFRMVFGSTRLSEQELSHKVRSYRSEFQSIRQFNSQA